MARTQRPRIGLRCSALFIAALLSFPVSSSAYDTPLSDTAIREAYFLGQRHDETYADFMNRYTRYIAPPKNGPAISSVTLLTPFAQVVQLSSQRSSGYSAQQAQLDHRGWAESIKVIVEIQLTPTYGALIPRPGDSRSNPTVGFAQRPCDFWSDIKVKVLSNDRLLKPFTFSGHPNYDCGDGGGACTLTGATIEMEVLASAFDSDSATIQIDPPEGEQLVVDFDLTTLR